MKLKTVLIMLVCFSLVTTAFAAPIVIRKGSGTRSEDTSTTTVDTTTTSEIVQTNTRAGIFEFILAPGANYLSFPTNMSSQGIVMASDLCSANSNITSIITTSTAAVTSSNIITYTCDGTGQDFEISFVKGYVVKTSKLTALVLIIDEAIPSASVNLFKGKNLIGWPSVKKLTMSSVLNSIDGKYTKVQRVGDGYAYYPDNPTQSDILHFEAGDSYHIYMDEDALLTFNLGSTVADPTYAINLQDAVNPQTVGAGETVAYTITITNEGNVGDTANLLVNDVTPFGQYLNMYSVYLDSAQTKSFQLSVTSPSTASHGDSKTTVVQAVSQGDNTVTDSVTVITTVEMAGGLTLQDIWDYINNEINPRLDTVDTRVNDSQARIDALETNLVSNWTHVLNLPNVTQIDTTKIYLYMQGNITEVNQTLWNYIITNEINWLAGTDLTIVWNAISGNITEINNTFNIQINELNQTIIDLDVTELNQTIFEINQTIVNLDVTELNQSIFEINQTVMDLDVTEINQTIFEMNGTMYELNQTLVNINQTINQTIIEVINTTFNETIYNMINQTFYDYIENTSMGNITAIWDYIYANEANWTKDDATVNNYGSGGGGGGGIGTTRVRELINESLEDLYAYLEEENLLELEADVNQIMYITQQLELENKQLRGNLSATQESLTLLAQTLEERGLIDDASIFISPLTGGVVIEPGEEDDCGFLGYKCWFKPKNDTITGADIIDVRPEPDNCGFLGRKCWFSKPTDNRIAGEPELDLTECGFLGYKCWFKRVDTLE